MPNVVDEFTRECLSLRVNWKLKSSEVTDILPDLFILGGAPEHATSGSVLELVAKTVQGGVAAVGANADFIELGSPWEIGNVESFNAGIRGEPFNGDIIYTVAIARVVVENWCRFYNMRCPHGPPGYRPQPKRPSIGSPRRQICYPARPQHPRWRPRQSRTYIVIVHSLGSDCYCKCVKAAPSEPVGPLREPVGELPGKLVGFILVKLVLGDTGCEEGAVTAPCHVVPRRNGEVGACVVIEADAVVEASRLGRQFPETPHAIRAIEKPPCGAQAQGRVVAGEGRQLPAVGCLIEGEENEGQPRIITQFVEQGLECVHIIRSGGYVGSLVSAKRRE